MRNLTLRSACLLVLAVVAILSARPLKASESLPDLNSTDGLSISGSVTADGRPASGAKVSLYKVGSTNPGNPGEFGVAGKSVTDDKGSFKFDSVGAGVFKLRVSLDGYVIATGIADAAGQPIYFRPGDSAAITMRKGGVIAGRVTGGGSLPLVEVPVTAVRVKDENGRPVHDAGSIEFDSATSWATDDRGVYRIYGLKGGVYLVSAGGGFQQFNSEQPYMADAPTFYPSNPRNTAVEVPVHEGDEVSGIDISYQGFSGHSINGTIDGAAPPSAVLNGGIIVLTNASTGAVESSTIWLQSPQMRSFRIHGVADGDHYLMAIGGIGSKQLTASDPVRLAVKGADVEGVHLTVAARPYISGRAVTIAVDPKPSAEKKCPAPPVELQEVVLKAVRESVIEAHQVSIISPLLGDSVGVPDDSGNFQIQVEASGRYHVIAGLPGPQFYMMSIKSPPVSEGKPPVDLSAGIDLKAGAKVEGVQIEIASDGASLAGKIVQAKAKEPLPIDLTVTLVPAEPESVDDVLRYSEAPVGNDGSFEITNLSPGKYFVLAARQKGSEWNNPERQPSYWNIRRRKQIEEQARSQKVMVELKPCQRLEQFSMSYPPAAPESGSSTAKPGSPSKPK